MRMVLLVKIVLGAFFWFSGIAQAQETLLSIVIEGPELPVKLGNPIEIIVSVTNVSDVPVHAFRLSAMGNGERDFSVTVLDDHRRSVSHTTRGKLQNFEPGGGCCFLIDGPTAKFLLDPGDIFRTSIPISDLFVVDRPGIYSIVVSTRSFGFLRFGIKESNSMINSNEIFVTVTN
jgi:hypothetical protein